MLMPGDIGFINCAIAANWLLVLNQVTIGTGFAWCCERTRLTAGCVAVADRRTLMVSENGDFRNASALPPDYLVIILA
jgi:hypothetical protein